MDMQFTDYTMDFKPFIADKNTWSWIAGKTEFPSNDSDTRCEVSWGDRSREKIKKHRARIFCHVSVDMKAMIVLSGKSRTNHRCEVLFCDFALVW